MAPRKAGPRPSSALEAYFVGYGDPGRFRRSGLPGPPTFLAISDGPHKKG